MNFNPDTDELPWERADREELDQCNEERAEFLYEQMKDRQIEDYFNKQERG